MAIETDQYILMLGRMIRAGGRRVAAADEPELAAFLALRTELDEAIQAAVLAQREELDRSWTWVGEALGMTRQGARQRFGQAGNKLAG